MLRKITLAFLFCLLGSGFTLAQSNEIGVLAGGMFTSDAPPSSCDAIPPLPNNQPQFCTTKVTTPSRISYEGVLAHRVLNAHLASLYVELPVVGTPTRSIVQGPFRQNYSSLYFTPGLKLKVSVPFLSPFVSVGGGFARYSPDTNGNLTNTSSSFIGAFDVGGGLDFSPIPFFGIRVEAREFHTGNPNFNVGTNNVFAGAGIVLKF